MLVAYTYKPLQFFAITFALLGTFGLVLTKPELIPGHPDVQLLLLMLLGLLTPFVTTLVMIYSSQSVPLQRDFQMRLRFTGVKLALLPYIVLLAPVTLCLALVISWLLGQPLTQCSLSPGFGWLNALITLILAPILEEIGWRGYGIDSLRAHFNLFQTSMLFAVLWGLWHVPAFFIPGSYQYSLLNTTALYSANFFVSLVPATIIMNWLYFKSGRNIIVAALFHSSLNFAATLLQITQFTKCLITLLLLIFALFIVMRNKPLFFNQ